jgi:hypothetical protein
MDTKLIQQYGEEILSYRLRTARQKKRMQHEDFDKKLIRLYKRAKELWRQGKTIIWEERDPPVQIGWKRKFVLIPEVAESNQAVFFENILRKINTHYWSHRKDFKVKQKKRGKKIYVVKEQHLLEPSERHFYKLEFTDNEKRMFYPSYRFEQQTGKLVKRYVFLEPWRFVLQTRPNMVNKFRKRDDQLESETAILNNFFERNDYEKRASVLLDGHYQYHWRGQIEKLKYKYQFNNKPLLLILDLTKEEVYKE